MTLSLILSIAWVFASTLVAILPMQRQYVPGVILLAAAPVLILWLGYDHGWWWSVLALFAFISMYRNPLIYFWRKWRGQEGP